MMTVTIAFDLSTNGSSVATNVIAKVGPGGHSGTSRSERGRLSSRQADSSGQSRPGPGLHPYTPERAGPGTEYRQPHLAQEIC